MRATSSPVNTRSHRLKALALLLAVPALLSACASGAAGPDAANTQPSAKTADYTLKVTEPANNGWLAVAKRDGVLEDALEPLGATVEWVPAKGAVTANLPLFSTGELQVSEGAYTPVVGNAAKNAPIKVGAVVVTPQPREDAGIVAGKDAGVAEVKDLIGKRVAVNPSGKGEYIVLRALEQAEIDPAEVQLEYLQPADALAAFAAGKVDAIATFGDFFRQASESGTVVATERDIDSKDSDIILFTDDLISERPDIAKAVVEAAKPLIADISKHPENFVNVFDTSGPRALSGAALDWQLRVNASEEATLRLPTDEDRADLQSIIDLFAANGVIPQGVKADALIADLG